MTEDDLQVRPAQAEDDAAVLGLLAATLGWSEDGVESDFFRWKHRDNPFGRSPAWVALIQDRIVGYRTFLRWEFLGDDDRVRRAVRAVDTVTDPDYRGRGIFRSLTLQGVADLTLDRSRLGLQHPERQQPAWLSLHGVAGQRTCPCRLPSAVAQALRQMVTARAPANLWSEPCDVGLDAARWPPTALAAALLAHAPQHGVRTHRTSGYLSWRSSFAPLRYRLLLVDESDSRAVSSSVYDDGRGAVEATVVEIARARIPRRAAADATRSPRDPVPTTPSAHAGDRTPH
jgi:GNAT superfamily N-acetyltransferase